MEILVLLISFIITYLFTKWLIPKLKAVGMTGKDINKENKPEVAEMGGLAIVLGITISLLLTIPLGLTTHTQMIFAVVSTITIIAIVGIIDDIVNMPQMMKFLLPIVASIPLIVITAGTTTMIIPFIGEYDFGIIYYLVLIPLGVTVASNLTNTFAGFNGLEAGSGAIIFLTFIVVSLNIGNTDMLLISLAMFGAMLAFLQFNWYPAKVFSGDVGNLTIGAGIACIVIIGNVETFGALLLLPHIIDLGIKAKNGFPSRGWNGECKDGYLYPPEKKVSFMQYLMKWLGNPQEEFLVVFPFVIQFAIAMLILVVFDV